MNNYYHAIPQCPQCGSPLNGPGGIIIKNGYYYICTGDGTECHIFGPALPWKIKLNEIEISYIDWIVKNSPKKILAITWPFRNPEIFSTILAYEYFKETESACMIVIPDGSHIAETSIGPEDLPRFICVEGEVTQSSINDIDVRDIFPKVRAYNYTLKNLSIHGRMHAGNIKGFKNKIKKIYGCEYASDVKIQGEPSYSRFGKMIAYDKSDFKSFHNHIETKMSDTVSRNKIIYHEYKNPEMLANYIERYKPTIIIMLDIIYPFIDETYFKNLNDHLKDRTVLLLGRFNQNEIQGVTKNIGTENIATLKSFEFMDVINDRINLCQDSDSRILDVKIVIYSTDLEVKLSDSALQNRVDKLLKIAKVTIHPLNLIAPDSGNYGLDDIFNDALNAGNGDYERLNDSIPDRTINPWADEIAEYIKNNNLNSGNNCIVISHNSSILDTINKHNLNRIKTVTVHGLLRSRFDTVIMTRLPYRFNPELVQADHIIFFTSLGNSHYIEYFFKNRKYLEYDNYFIFNDKNMPARVSEFMKKVGIGENLETEINYDYTPAIIGSNMDAYENDNNEQVSRYMIKGGEMALFLYDNAENYVALPINMDIYVIKSGMLMELNTGDGDVINKIIGSIIPLDRSGFYASVKARLIYFLIQNSATIKINGMGFLDAYKMSRMWLDKLEEISKTRSDLAREISALGITARNEYYISTWWRVTEIYRYVYIYRIERPKSEADMIKIFKFIEEISGDKNFTPEMAIRCYGYCVGIQHIRNNLLQGKFPSLRERLAELISSISETSTNFQASLALIRNADRDINAMVIHNKDQGAV